MVLIILVACIALITLVTLITLIALTSLSSRGFHRKIDTYTSCLWGAAAKGQALSQQAVDRQGHLEMRWHILGLRFVIMHSGVGCSGNGWCGVRFAAVEGVGVDE
jgi:hypothetical protein